MKPACPNLRLLIALLTAAAFSPMSFAAYKPPSQEVQQRTDWTYYIASCNQLDRQIRDNYNGRVGDSQEASNKLRAILQTMQSHLAGTTCRVIDPQQLDQCQVIYDCKRLCIHIFHISIFDFSSLFTLET